MRSIRRTIAIMLAVLSIGGTALAPRAAARPATWSAASSPTTSLNHVLGKRNANKLFCLYHGHRVLVDLRNHHPVIAGLNAIEAYRACKGGFFHSR